MVVTIGGIPVYDALIADDECGMFRISLVDDPAVMSNFQAFENARKPMMYAIQDEEKRLVRGVVMRADFPIYRRDANGEYYVIYKAAEIRKMAEKYLVEGRQNIVNTMHQDNSDVEGVQMVQYFIKGDGISVEGYDDIADGSLFAEFHIINEEVWNAVKDGTYKGFSLEGVFELTPEQDKERTEEIVDVLDGAFSRIFKHSTDKQMSKLSRLKEALAKALQEFGNITTDKGVLAWEGEEDIMVGDAVYIEDAEGNRTDAEDGDYTSTDNKVYVVVDGKVAEIKDAEVEVMPETETEIEVEEAFTEVSTDNGTLIYDAEELVEGIAVFVAGEEGNIPAPNGDYATEDNKVIKVEDGVIVSIEEKEAEAEPTEAEAPSVEEELRKENETLRSQVAELQAMVAEMQKMSAAKPAHEEVTTSSKFEKTGNKGLDNLARILSAK